MIISIFSLVLAAQVVPLGEIEVREPQTANIVTTVVTGSCDGFSTGITFINDRKSGGRITELRLGTLDRTADLPTANAQVKGRYIEVAELMTCSSGPLGMSVKWLLKVQKENRLPPAYEYIPVIVRGVHR